MQSCGGGISNKNKSRIHSDLTLCSYIPSYIQFLLLIASWSLLESSIASLSSYSTPLSLLTVVTDAAQEMKDESQLNPS